MPHRSILLLVASLGLVAACGSPDIPGYQRPALSIEQDAGSASSSTAAVTASGATSMATSSVQPAPAPDSCDASAPGAVAATQGSCQPAFASGVNVAWVSFGSDIPNPDIATFTALFKNTYAAGGRVVRWWLHTDGRSTPGYDASGRAAPISCSNIADIKRVLDAAHEAGVMLNVSLWSFDMLQGSLSPSLLANNINLLTEDTYRQAYIDNVLTPLVTALRGHPGLYSWEIFNEAEGMTTQHGWVRPPADAPETGPLPNRIDEAVVQTTVNWFADAIHLADPHARVTTGAWTFQVNANVSGMQDAYSDSALLAAGGRSRGALDYYEVHYYSSNGAKNSPFIHPASSWNLDKRVVIGEFYAVDQGTVAAADVYTTLHDNGYGGAWAWQYEHNDCSQSGCPSTKWPAMQVPMQNLFMAHAEDLVCPGATPAPRAVLAR